MTDMIFVRVNKMDSRDFIRQVVMERWHQMDEGLAKTKQQKGEFFLSRAICIVNVLCLLYLNAWSGASIFYTRNFLHEIFYTRNGLPERTSRVLHPPFWPKRMSVSSLSPTMQICVLLILNLLQHPSNHPSSLHTVAIRVHQTREASHHHVSLVRHVYHVESSSSNANHFSQSVLQERQKPKRQNAKMHKNQKA